MTKTAYRTARRLIRANGRYALRWLDAGERETMQLVLERSDLMDPLEERSDILGYCRREGYACNDRHTAARKAA